MVSLVKTENLYTQRGRPALLAPALVVVTAQFKTGKSFNTPPAIIQRQLLERVGQIAPQVRAVHIDLNCQDYVDNQPDNTPIFTPRFLAAIRETALLHHRKLFIDLHLLGQDIWRRGREYALVIDNLSLELAVAEKEQNNFERILFYLNRKGKSLGLIGTAETPADSYWRYADRVDILGVTAGQLAGRTLGEIDLQPGLRLVKDIRQRGFRGGVIFQLGVTAETLDQIKMAGADILVCGSEIFKPFAKTPAEITTSLKRLNEALLKRPNLWNYFLNKAETKVVGIINDWHKTGRLSAPEAAALVKDLQSGAVQEYLRGFGCHLAIKGLTEAANWIAWGLIVAGQGWLGALILGAGALLRTAYTLTRMWQNQNKKIAYTRALIYGLNPVALGVLAFPLQMIGGYHQLTRVIVGHSALKCARIFSAIPGLRKYQPKLESLFIWPFEKLNTPLSELLKS